MRAHVRYGLVEITDNFGVYGSAEWRERRRRGQKRRA
jgi:hypothetical protein